MREDIINIILVLIAGALVTLTASFCIGSIIKRIKTKQSDIMGYATYSIISVAAIATAIKLVGTLLKVI